MKMRNSSQVNMEKSDKNNEKATRGKDWEAFNKYYDDLDRRMRMKHHKRNKEQNHKFNIP